MYSLVFHFFEGSVKIIVFALKKKIISMTEVE